MTSNSLAIAGSNLPAGVTPIPTRVGTCLVDAWGEWHACDAIAKARSLGVLDDIPALAERAQASLRPMDRERLGQRLTMLGAAMSPNRPSDAAGAWLLYMETGLNDVPEDLLSEALDEWIRVSKFLPTVAELRELIEPKLKRRKREAFRLSEMASATGRPVQAIGAGEHLQQCTPEDATRIMAEFGIPSLAADREERRHLGPARKPSATDYLEMGVPAEAVAKYFPVSTSQSEAA